MLRERFNTHPMKRPFFRALRAYAAERVRPGQDLLDIASNDFRMAACFPGVRYVGADIEPALLVAGKRRHPGEAHQGVACDIRHLPFADGSFDIVVSTHTLVHVEGAAGKRRALGELKRVLRAGGDLVFNVRTGAQMLKLAEAAVEGRFERIERVEYRRTLMSWWEETVVTRGLGAGGPVPQVLAALSPLIAALDRWGAPRVRLYLCAGYRGGEA